MEFDRLKVALVSPSKPDFYLSDKDDEEVYAVSDSQLLSHLVGEVSKVGLDDDALGSCFKLQARNGNLEPPPLSVILGQTKRPK
jgi:hypothetical protein